jgi:hypothetical protein
MRTQDEFVLQEYERNIKAYMKAKGYSCDASEEYATLLAAKFKVSGDTQIYDELMCIVQLIIINTFTLGKNLINLEGQATYDIADIISYLNAKLMELLDSGMLFRNVTVVDAILDSIKDINGLTYQEEMDPIQTHKEDIIDEDCDLDSLFAEYTYTR